MTIQLKKFKLFVRPDLKSHLTKMKKTILFTCLVHLYYLSHLQCLCYTIVKDTTLSQSSSLTTTNFQTNHHNDENTKSSSILQNHEQHPEHQRNFSPKYHYTIDELLNTTFPTRISDDIDLDPCKSGKLLP